jgi:hypothetical protein
MGPLRRRCKHPWRNRWRTRPLGLWPWDVSMVRLDRYRFKRWMKYWLKQLDTSQKYPKHIRSYQCFFFSWDDPSILKGNEKCIRYRISIFRVTRIFKNEGTKTLLNWWLRNNILENMVIPNRDEPFENIWNSQASNIYDRHLSWAIDLEMTRPNGDTTTKNGRWTWTLVIWKEFPWRCPCLRSEYEKIG